MTNEQWDYITSRLMALETFVAAIAGTMPEGPGRAAVNESAEDVRTGLLDTQLSDQQIEQIDKRIRDLASLAWGPDGSDH